MSARKGLIGVGIGLAAAGAATAAGIATDRIIRSRRKGAIEVAVDDSSGQVVVAGDGVPLYVEVDETPDAAATVVFVHGYAHNNTVWAHQRAAVRDAGYRVVAFDLRGHGRSGEGDESSYTIEQLAADIVTVLEQTAPDGSLVLVGHSMGGMALMALAERCPELIRDRVLGIALISTTAGGLSELNFGLGKQLGGVVHRLGPAAVTRVGSRQDLFDVARLVGRSVESALVHRYSFGGPVPKKVVRQVAEMIFATKLQVIGMFLPTLMEHDRRAALPAFEGIETLIVHGTRDRITPIDHGAQLASALPGAEFVEVLGAGHVLPLEDPELVTGQLLAFLRRATRSVPHDADGASDPAPEQRDSRASR